MWYIFAYSFSELLLNAYHIYRRLFVGATQFYMFMVCISRKERLHLLAVPAMGVGGRVEAHMPSFCQP